MQSDTLVQHHPPTPPGLNPDLHAGLHQIAQYNDSPDYAHEGSPPYSTGYSSISPVMHEASQHSPHMMSHVDVDGLGIRYVRQIKYLPLYIELMDCRMATVAVQLTSVRAHSTDFL